MSEKSRIILPTGVTRGLGRALVDEFVAVGHIVWGCGRSPEAVSELHAKFPAPSDWRVVDVADATAVGDWASRLLASGKVPDLVINNAALMNDPAATWEVSAAEFDRLIDVNIKGVANVNRAFMPAMVARKSGVVINLSSGWGRSVSPEVGPYCTTKWAMEGMSKAMAEEVPSGMAVVPLNPGIIDTAMLRQCWAEGAASFHRPAQWAKKAAPFILGIGPKDNGRSLTVPG
jgi:NAD(P)-dependent dehydrogenase (short-subunit alcohol dehydrogenase family)